MLQIMYVEGCVELVVLLTTFNIYNFYAHKGDEIP